MILRNDDLPPIWQKKKGKHTEWKMKLWNSALYFWCARVCLTIYTSFGVFPWISTLSLSPLICVRMEMSMYVCIKTFIVTLSLNSIYLHFQNQNIIVLDNPSRHYCHIIVVNGLARDGTAQNGKERANALCSIRFESRFSFIIHKGNITFTLSNVFAHTHKHTNYALTKKG